MIAFTHYTDLTEIPCISSVITKHGLEGYGIIIRIMEVLTASSSKDSKEAVVVSMPETEWCKTIRTTGKVLTQVITESAPFIQSNHTGTTLSVTIPYLTNYLKGVNSGAEVTPKVGKHKRLAWSLLRARTCAPAHAWRDNYNYVSSYIHHRSLGVRVGFRGWGIKNKAKTFQNQIQNQNSGKAKNNKELSNSNHSYTTADLPVGGGAHAPLSSPTPQVHPGDQSSILAQKNTLATIDTTMKKMRKVKKLAGCSPTNILFEPDQTQSMDTPTLTLPSASAPTETLTPSSTELACAPKKLFKRVVKTEKPSWLSVETASTQLSTPSVKTANEVTDVSTVTVKKTPRRSRVSKVSDGVLIANQVEAMHRKVYPLSTYNIKSKRGKIVGTTKQLLKNGVPPLVIIQAFSSYLEEKSLQNLKHQHSWERFLYLLPKLLQTLTPVSEDAVAVATLLAHQIQSVFPQIYPVEKAPIQSWAHDFESVLQSGGSTASELATLVDWYPKDQWWRFKILDAGGVIRNLRALQAAKISFTLAKRSHRSGNYAEPLPHAPNFLGMPVIVSGRAH